MAADLQVDAVLTDNRLLSGTFTTADNVALTPGMRVLAAGQSVVGQNEIYTVAAGAWTKDTNITLTYGMDIQVKRGDTHGLSRWTLATDATIIRDGTLTLHFEEQYRVPYVDAAALLLEEATGEGEGSGAAYLDGLRPEWVNSDRVDIHPGEAYVPGYGGVVSLDTTTSVFAVPTGTAQLVHCYLKASTSGVGSIIARRETLAGSPDPEPYAGEAQTLNPDGAADYTYYRYLVSWLQDASSNIIRFAYNPATGRYEYITGWNGPPVRVVTLGTSTSFQVVSTWGSTAPPGLVPDGARFAILNISAGNGATVQLGNSDVGLAVLFTQSPGSSSEKSLPLSSSGDFQWKNADINGNTLISVMGYIMARA